jgi:hypothetical protein
MALFTNLFSSKARHQDKREAVVTIGNSRFDVVIIEEMNYQAALETIGGPRVPMGVNRFETAWLILEDKNRVRVEIHGRKVGYLDAEAVIQYRKQLTARGKPKADGQCQALIRGGWVSSDGRKGSYSVSLDIPISSF